MLKTRDVCRIHNVPPLRIRHLLAAGRIPAPSKDSSGDFIWQEDDVARLLEAVPPRRRQIPASVHAGPQNAA
jgi:hypothetical protein